MKRSVLLPAALLAAALLGPRIASAQDADLNFCAANPGNVDERPAAVTRAITSGRLSPQNLAISFYNRGIWWADKREYDRAISDYTEALRIDPGYSNAYHNRGNAWHNKREYDKAIADFNESIRLTPQYN